MTDILVCLHDFSRGGTERIAIGLARDWTDAGCGVAILCGSQAGGLRETVDPRVRVIALSPPVERSPLSRLRLGNAMAAQAGGSRSAAEAGARSGRLRRQAATAAPKTRIGNILASLGRIGKS